jgi:ribosomal peptide maturation radical SAM protein 1
LTSAGGVTLVCMPFGHVFSPSIGLSLLQAELASQGISAPIRYFSIRFAQMIGQAFYCGLSSEGKPSMEDLAGEWIFARALFGPRASDEEYVERILFKRSASGAHDPARPASPALVRRILHARAQVDGFLEGCRQDILETRPKVVGFTSMFQQHVASLALARLIKQSLPEAFVVFGGANCEDVMGAETVRQFPFVDAAVSGEADLVFPELVRRVLEGVPLGGLAGVRTRAGVDAEFSGGRFSLGPMVRDLDALPYPDYVDYFEQFDRSRFGRQWSPNVYLETSRGCWWGERMHCTFCGLNSQTMAFRKKSPKRALAELDWLSERHPDCTIELTDNILDMGYFKDFVPALAARPPGPALFYEVKSNLRKDQVRMLREAGIRRIQPGIESFSDPVLKLMRKGVSALQNIQLLKWCKELGVEPAWNLLWGFPGEPPEEYERMARLVPLLTHLPPPQSHGTIRLDRFSPNFNEAERLGFTEVRPLPPYRYVYALPAEALANLAYFFAFDYREPRDVAGYVARLDRALRAWRKRGEEHDLFSVDRGAHLLVWDLRPMSHAPLTVLAGADRILYQACDSARDLGQLAECLARAAEPLAGEAIERRLAPLLDRGLLVTDGARYLALAIPLGEYSPSASVVARLHELATTLGRRVPGGWVVSHGTAVTEAGKRGRGERAPSRMRRAAVARRLARLSASQFSVDEQGDVLIRRESTR